MICCSDPQTEKAETSHRSKIKAFMSVTFSLFPIQKKTVSLGYRSFSALTLHTHLVTQVSAGKACSHEENSSVGLKREIPARMSN